MAISKRVKDVLLKENRINILSTSNKKGHTDIAVFGSAALTADEYFTLVLKKDSRSLVNIKENPYASCLILLPEEGGKGLKIKGCRIYLKSDLIDLSRNPVLLKERGEGDDVEWEKSFNVQTKKDEKDTKDKDNYLVRFKIIEVRPIVDTGQGI